MGEMMDDELQQLLDDDEISVAEYGFLAGYMR